MTQMDLIDVPLRASLRLALLLVVTHTAAMVSVVAMPVPWWQRFAGCSLLLASAVIMIRRRALLRVADSVVRLQLKRDGSCELVTRDQRLISGNLCPGWFVSPLMVVVRFACPGERLSRVITLLPDSADADSLRQLRVFLRFAIDP